MLNDLLSCVDMSDADKSAHSLDLSDVDQEDLQSYQNGKVMDDCKSIYSEEMLSAFNYPVMDDCKSIYSEEMLSAFNCPKDVVNFADLDWKWLEDSL